MRSVDLESKDHYSARELTDTFLQMVKTNGYKITSEAIEKLNDIMNKVSEERADNSEKESFVRNLFLQTCQNQAIRTSHHSLLPKEKLHTIEDYDIL